MPCYMGRMPEQTMQREFLGVQELADLFNLTPAAVYTQRHRGEAPGALGVKVGRRLVWRRSDLDTWWDEQREAQAVGCRVQGGC